MSIRKADWKVVTIGVLVALVFYTQILDRNLEGYHILIQFMPKSTSTFYINSQGAGDYLYQVRC